MTNLTAKRAELRHMLDNLTAMAAQGLPVAEAKAEIERQLAEIEAHLAAAPEAGATFDQQQQQIESQTNVAGNYYAGPVY